jgi:hypothetical protein
MSAVDTRNIHRDSLFMMANLFLEGNSTPYRVKVRNLSEGGMMAEDGPAVVRGANLVIDLKNIGPVEGVVAWVQEDRFGIAFAAEIDPKLARTPVGNSDISSPRFTRPSTIDSGQNGIKPDHFRNL